MSHKRYHPTRHTEKQLLTVLARQIVEVQAEADHWRQRCVRYSAQLKRTLVALLRKHVALSQALEQSRLLAQRNAVLAEQVSEMRARERRQA